MAITEKVNANISFSQELSEWNACIDAGLDLWDWINGKYPKRFMAKVLARYVVNQQIETHFQDAVNREMKRKQRKGRK